MCFCRLRGFGPLALVLMLCCGVFPRTWAQHSVPSPASSFPALDWLRDILEEFSRVDVQGNPGGGPKQTYTTRTPGLNSEDSFVLKYERATRIRSRFYRRAASKKGNTRIIGS